MTKNTTKLAACNEDNVKLSGSGTSLLVHDISPFDCCAQSDEYIGSILTGTSQQTSRTVSDGSICLDAHVSSSLLIKNGFYCSPEDSGIEAFSQSEDSATPLDKYYDGCTKFMLVPAGALKRCLENQDQNGAMLNLRNYGVDTLGAYLIFQALVGPPVALLTHLDFTNSPFDEVGCITLSELMQQSRQLTYVNLSGCRIGSRGAEVLAEGIEISQSITDLNLSGCDLKDVGGAMIVKSIVYNENCKILDISKNELQNLTATELAVLFKENQTLDNLNLKWNNLYPEYNCSVVIFKAFQKNENLKELNISWNGLSGKSFAQVLFRALKAHRFLKILNLESNRLSEIELKSILSIIKNSTSLEELYLAGNTWSHSDLFELIKAVAGDVTLKILDIGEHVWIPENCYNLAQKITSFKPDVKIIFKGKILPNPPDSVDFKAIIIDRAKYLAMAPKKKKLKRNLGHFMINAVDEERLHYRRESFEELIKKFKSKLDADLVDHLGTEFTDKVKIGTNKATAKRVALKEMATYYLRRHPTERPPPPPPKKKKGRKEKKDKKDQKGNK